MNKHERKDSLTFSLKPVRGNFEFPCGELAEVDGFKNVSLNKRNIHQDAAELQRPRVSFTKKMDMKTSPQ